MERHLNRKRGRPRKIIRGIPFKKKRLVPPFPETAMDIQSIAKEPAQQSEKGVGKSMASETDQNMDVSDDMLNTMQTDQTVEIAQLDVDSKTSLEEACLKKKKKKVTLQELLEIAPVNVISLTTDLLHEESSTGPWWYINSSKCIIKFVESDAHHSMRLNNFLSRGKTNSEKNMLNFRWYSWLRLKSIANKQNISVNSVVRNEGYFLSLLSDVNKFYMKNTKRVKEENLETNKGPQSLTEALDLQRLHYYGNGQIKYYRKTTFLELLAQKYGEITKAEYLVNPATPLINEVDYEFLLTEVHHILYTNYARHLKKLKEFAGPQCNEDRNNSKRVNYDVKFTSSLSTKQTIDFTNAKDAMEPNVDLGECNFGEFFLRKCQKCNKLRWVGKKAAEKYVLGSYTYAGVKRKVQFSCNLLHNTSCDTENDISPSSFEACKSVWVAFSNLPVVGLVFKIIRSISHGVYEVEVLAKYTCTTSQLTNNNFKVICARLVSDRHVELGKKLSTTRFQRLKDTPKLLVGTLNLIKPREALVCQSWLDNSSSSSENPNANYTVTNLCGIRDVHAVYKSMKLIHCIHCGMCSPGFEAEIDECVTVPEAGRQVPLYNDSLISSLKQSRVLSCGSVVLDNKFAAARVIESESVKGVCTDCSKYCTIDEVGQISLLHNEISGNSDQTSQETENSQEPISDNVSNINPYSVGNLMSLDVFQDEASQQHAIFMDTLTQAEKLVISPIHAVIVILRSRTNNIPFSRFGTISFAVREPVKTACLPWHTFKQLPFVVMVSNNEDGSITEAKINMAKIIHAKELMEREVTCPVYGIKRPFYRYCDKVHTPFSAYAMEKLAGQLSDCSTSVIPEGLRKLSVQKVHERSFKRLSFQLFSEWITSGFTIGSTIKESFFIEINDSQLSKYETGMITEKMWKELQDYVKRTASNTDESTMEKESKKSSTECIAVTPSDVIKYAVEKNWLNESTDVTSMSIKNLSDLSVEDELQNLVYLACEELELLLRETSNDEGESSSVAQGGVDGFHTEDPETIISKGIQKTVLQRIPGPTVDRAVPVAEDTPGYLPMAFPDVFLTGDGCPHQERPRSIINSSGGYKFSYLKWVCQQPRAMMNTELQFLIHSMIKRQHSKGKAKLAMKNDVFNNEGLPLKEELINNAQFRDWTVSSLMMFKSSIPDTTPFWKRARDDAIAVQRDWEDTVPWRGDKTPLSVMLFQTRAPPYNHHPAIHQLCPDAMSLSMGTDEEFMLGRQRNVLKYPSIVSFMCALMAELDTTFLGKLRNNLDSYFTRFEWGANANPHSHRLCFSHRFSEKMKSLKQHIELCLQNSKDEVLKSGQDLSDQIVQESIRTKVLDCWDQARQEYIQFMRPFYTNWNAGLLSDGSKKTFDFVFERQTTTCRLNMAMMIDQALNTGQFSELDTVYVSVVNGTCRHLGHTGLNDKPAKNDKCAVVKRKRVKTSNSSVKYKEVITCKRRKPQPISNTPTIQPDVCNKKLFQLQFESNDKWFNGHDPFEILHILSNADDKAVVPEFLRKPPTLNVTKNLDNENAVDLDMQYFADTGDSATEYVTKYAFKDVIHAKTPAQVLVTAMENLEDSEPINQGTVQKMYNVHANAGTTSIFQATHLNQSIPHVLSNVNIKSCNISGLSLFRNDYNEEDGEDYLIPNLIKQFDGRHDSSVICIERGKQSLELKEEIQKEMCLHQFCDLYDVKECKHDGEQKRVLHFRRRSNPREGRMNALKLIPCHGKGVANPRNKLYWNFCRTLCLWKIPCHKTSDFTPAGDDEDSLKKGWIELFNNFFIDGKGLPPWALKYWKHYNEDHNNDSDTSSDEDDPELQDNINDRSNIDKKREDESKVEKKIESNCQPVVGAGHEQFYQNPIDRLRAAQHTTQQLDLETTTSSNFDPAVLANPEGVDFMDSWLGDQILPSVQELHVRMANVASSEGKLYGGDFDVSTLNEKQKIAHDLVVEYVNNRLQWEQNDQKGNAPKPLRLIIMGNPGTGKSWTLKCIMTSLIKRLGFDGNSDGEPTPTWTEKIKLAAPTGAASSQMYFNAQTLHRLFCIPISLCEKDLHLDENSKAFSKLLLNFDPNKFILLIIDEFSMVSRQIFAFITQRMIQCSIDIQKIGIVLIGDPAQILPIASDPLWSARLKTDQGKDCSNVSILGMMRFREIFNFQQMQTIPNFDKWQNLSTPKKRLLSDEITACRKNLMKGDFSAVFLTEVKRSENDPISQQFTGKVLVNLRYGRKCREIEIDFLRKHCATEEETTKQKKWRTANIIHGYHFHSKDNENRPSVEADNARALLRHNQDTGNPIMRIDSIHHPTDKENKLKSLPAKMFEGAPPSWYASKGMRVMLLRNIAPSVGLFNGSIHTLVGPIYNNDSVEVLLKLEHLQSAVIRDHKTILPIECSGEGTVIPPNSVLLSVNGNKYDDDTLNDTAAKTELKCKFNLPSTPPAMPDFMVIEASNYTGPNILKLPGFENYVPIAPVENFKEDKNKSKKNQVRIALPLEGGYAATSFKGQGSTFHLAEVDLDGWFHVPGIFLVAISRVKKPRHLHIRKLPNSLDLTMQRMKENVLDAQAFEEAVRTKSESHYRKSETCGDPFWSTCNNIIADLVIQEALSSGKSIKNNSEEINDTIAESHESIERNNIKDVICKFMQTKEYLVAEKAPHITVNDYETLQNYQKNKSVKNKPENANSIVNIKDIKDRNFSTRPSLKRNAKSNKSVIKENPYEKFQNPDSTKNVRNELKSNTETNTNKYTFKDKGVAWSARTQNQVIYEHSIALKAQPDLSNFTLKGLQNSGNNICFINAAIIALCHSKFFDTFLRECHAIHEGCTGSLVDDEPCPLCALYEIMNRAYRHHRLQLNDIQHTPIIKLTKSLLLGWNIGIEHDADEFLTNLLQRLDETVGFSLHKGTVRIISTCKKCKVERNKEKQQPLRISLNLSQMQNENVRIQDGVMKWLFQENLRICTSCGEYMHSDNRILIVPPTLLIININRFVNKKTLVDHQILVNDHIYIFRSSINFHPGHYTAVGCVADNHYVYYSDEDVQSCHGRIIDNEHYQIMNRVRTPLEDNSTVLLYDLQTALDT